MVELTIIIKEKKLYIIFTENNIENGKDDKINIKKNVFIKNINNRYMTSFNFIFFKNHFRLPDYIVRFMIQIKDSHDLFI